MPKAQRLVMPCSMFHLTGILNRKALKTELSTASPPVARCNFHLCPARQHAAAADSLYPPHCDGQISDLDLSRAALEGLAEEEELH